MHVFQKLVKEKKRNRPKCMHNVSMTLYQKKILFYNFYTYQKKKKKRKLNACLFPTIVCWYSQINRQHLSLFQKIFFMDTKNYNLS